VLREGLAGSCGDEGCALTLRALSPA